MIEFYLNIEDDAPILLETLLSKALHHRIPYVLIGFDIDDNFKGLPQNTIDPCSVYFASSEEEVECLENQICGGGHCITYKLVDGTYLIS